MEAKTSWKIPTLQTLLDSEPKGSIELPFKILQGTEKKLYQCEGCGCYCKAAELVDVSPLDGVPNDWACGGCREHMERNLIDTDKKGKPKDRREVKQKLLKAHGAPKEVIDSIGLIQNDKKT